MANIVPAILNVILDVESRWNATHNMLTKFKTLIGFQFKCFLPKINPWMNIGWNLEVENNLTNWSLLKKSGNSCQNLSSLHCYSFYNGCMEEIHLLFTTNPSLDLAKEAILSNLLCNIKKDVYAYALFGSKIQVCLIKKKENILLW